MKTLSLIIEQDHTVIDVIHFDVSHSRNIEDLSSHVNDGIAEVNKIITLATPPRYMVRDAVVGATLNNSATIERCRTCYRFIMQ